MIRYTSGLAALVLATAGPALAQNTGGVFGPVVNEGHRAFEYRMGYDPDSDGFAHRLHYQQALNADTMWRIVGQARKSEGSGHGFDYVQGELFWQITPDESAWQQGLRFDARIRDGDRPGTFGINWMNQFAISPDWQARGILMTAVDLGQNRRDGILLQVRGQLARALGEGRQVGVELFSGLGSTRDMPDLDDQSHQFGPFATFRVAGVTVYGSVLLGLSQGAPDTNLALWVTKSL